MKPYLITSGGIFALIAVLHAARAISERTMFARDPIEYCSLAALGLVAAALALWAFRLLRRV